MHKTYDSRASKHILEISTSFVGLIGLPPKSVDTTAIYLYQVEFYNYKTDDQHSFPQDFIFIHIYNTDTNGVQ